MAEVRPVTFRHSDGVITYQPALDVSPADGWRTQCDFEKLAALGPPELQKLQCVGNSRRTTSRSGASFEFTFYGSSAKVYGAVSGGSFTVALDNQSGVSHSAAADPTAGVLTEVLASSQGTHVVRITLDSGNGQLDFEQVVFDAGVRSDWTNATMDMRLNSPGWSFVSWVHLKHFYHNLDGSDTARFQEGVATGTLGAKAEFTFFGSAVYLIGNFIDDHGRYFVTLDTVSAEYNGKANYTVETGLLFFAAGLDPNLEHTLTVTNADQDFLDIIRTVVASGPLPIDSSNTSTSMAPISTSPSGTSSSTSRNAARIVGASLGSVFALCAIVLLAFVLVFRRRKRERNARRPYAQNILAATHFDSRPSSPPSVLHAETPPADPWSMIPMVHMDSRPPEDTFPRIRRT